MATVPTEAIGNVLTSNLLRGHPDDSERCGQGMGATCAHHDHYLPCQIFMADISPLLIVETSLDTERHYSNITSTGAAPLNPSWVSVTRSPACGGNRAEKEPTLTRSPGCRAWPLSARARASQTTAFSG